MTASLSSCRTAYLDGFLTAAIDQGLDDDQIATFLYKSAAALPTLATALTGLTKEAGLPNTPDKQRRSAYLPTYPLPRPNNPPLPKPPPRQPVQPKAEQPRANFWSRLFSADQPGPDPGPMSDSPGFSTERLTSERYRDQELLRRAEQLNPIGAALLQTPIPLVGGLGAVPGLARHVATGARASAGAGGASARATLAGGYGEAAAASHAASQAAQASPGLLGRALNYGGTGALTYEVGKDVYSYIRPPTVAERAKELARESQAERLADPERAKLQDQTTAQYKEKLKQDAEQHQQQRFNQAAQTLSARLARQDADPYDVLGTISTDPALVALTPYQEQLQQLASDPAVAQRLTSFSESAPNQPSLVERALHQAYVGNNSGLLADKLHGYAQELRGQELRQQQQNLLRGGQSLVNHYRRIANQPGLMGALMDQQVAKSPTAPADQMGPSKIDQQQQLEQDTELAKHLELPPEKLEALKTPEQRASYSAQLAQLEKQTQTQLGQLHPRQAAQRLAYLQEQRAQLAQAEAFGLEGRVVPIAEMVKRLDNPTDPLTQLAQQKLSQDPALHATVQKYQAQFQDPALAGQRAIQDVWNSLGQGPMGEFGRVLVLGGLGVGLVGLLSSLFGGGMGGLGLGAAGLGLGALAAGSTPGGLEGLGRGLMAYLQPAGPYQSPGMTLPVTAGAPASASGASATPFTPSAARVKNEATLRAKSGDPYGAAYSLAQLFANNPQMATRFHDLQKAYNPQSRSFHASLFGAPDSRGVFDVTPERLAARHPGQLNKEQAELLLNPDNFELIQKLYQRLRAGQR